VSYEFPQYVGYFNEGETIEAKLTKKWAAKKDVKKDGRKIFITTQPKPRRLFGWLGTPEVIVIDSQHQLYAEFVALNSGSVAAHKKIFDDQAADRVKKNRAIDLVGLVADFLKG